jgi:hypothetical protein
LKKSLRVMSVVFWQSRASPKDKPVTVLVDEDMAEIARRVRAKAKARGMTDEVFEALTKDL